MNEFDKLLDEMLGNHAKATPKEDDLETWLLTVGNDVIAKRAQAPAAALTAAETAIYCLWVLDYAVRNAGTLEPMREMHASAAKDLAAFARTHALRRLAAWVKSAANEEKFCDTYFDTFEPACAELRAFVQVPPPGAATEKK